MSYTCDYTRIQLVSRKEGEKSVCENVFKKMNYHDEIIEESAIMFN